MTSTYDGGVYSKRLVDRMWDIAECLGTFTMVGVFEEMTGWEGFEAFIRSGAGSRTTVGLMAHHQPRDRTQAIEDAQARMFEMLDKLHALRNVHFRMSPEAAARWFPFTVAKEEKNRAMVEDDESEGLVLWARKYDMRIVAMATVFQAIEFIEGGQKDCIETDLPADPQEDSREEKLGPKALRTVTISEANLVAAARLVEGYLFDVQRVFYERAAGMTEFHKELLNFAAYRIVSDDPLDPERRIVPRSDLTHNGPRRLRGSITDAKKELHRRWVQALLDHGFIEVYEKPGARPIQAAASGLRTGLVQGARGVHRVLQGRPGVVADALRSVPPAG